MLSGDDVPDGRPLGAERPAATLVVRLHDTNPHGADGQLVAGLDLRDDPETAPPEEPSSPRGTTSGSSMPSEASDGRSRWS